MSTTNPTLHHEAGAARKLLESLTANALAVTPCLEAAGPAPASC